MTSRNFDWLDRRFNDEGREFGRQREELRLAEATLSPDIPDDLLLRLYYFVTDRACENETWEVIEDLTERLVRSRIYGGPKKRPHKYARGFDPKDHVSALEAVRAGALPNDNLLDLYQVAEVNSGKWGKSTGEFQNEWKPIFSLIREQILERMAAGRARNATKPVGGAS